MARRYEEPIEVRSRVGVAVGGPDSDRGLEISGPGAPESFIWRGRLYVVREVLGHWQERHPWWRDALDPDPGAASPRGVLGGSGERQVWRVEASPGRMSATGVFDLGAGAGPHPWRLVHVVD
jgi:hypothetical protein